METKYIAIAAVIIAVIVVIIFVMTRKKDDVIVAVPPSTTDSEVKVPDKEPVKVPASPDTTIVKIPADPAKEVTVIPVPEVKVDAPAATVPDVIITKDPTTEAAMSMRIIRPKNTGLTASMYGADWAGHTYSTVTAATKEDCETACEQDQSCNLSTYNTVTKSCDLKKFVASKGTFMFKSGSKDYIAYDNVDLPGHDINYDVQPSIKDCAKSCTDTADCLGVFYSSTDNVCYRKKPTKGNDYIMNLKI